MPYCLADRPSISVNLGSSLRSVCEIEDQAPISKQCKNIQLLYRRQFVDIGSLETRSIEYLSSRRNERCFRYLELYLSWFE